MRRKSTNNLHRFLSCAIMVLALLWLTVSTPFVYSQQQMLLQQNIEADISIELEEEANPFANTTEEKTESGSNTLSEYLHDLHLHEQYTIGLAKFTKCHPSDLYYAFHPELISPPPESSFL